MSLSVAVAHPRPPCTAAAAATARLPRPLPPTRAVATARRALQRNCHSLACPAPRLHCPRQPPRRVAVHAAAAAVEEAPEEEEEDAVGAAPEHVLLVDNFLPSAPELRALFDERFNDPRETTPERFLWDYWHVPQQYTLLRTPAHIYFPPELYQPLEDALLEFGQEMLGCRSLTQVWLSYYVDGMAQELHADVPHGPWAFVLSLTDWERRRFDGGETQILRPHVLDFWRTFDSERGLEFDDVMQTIEPEFNRLTVFDPRLPHGVRRVEGTKDPRHGRLVLHGWFAEPAPFFQGALEVEEAAEALDSTLDSLYNELETVGMALGTVTARLHVAGDTGAVVEVALLTDTLIAHPSNEDAGEVVREDILSLITSHLGSASFPASTSGEDTFITVPFLFQ